VGLESAGKSFGMDEFLPEARLCAFATGSGRFGFFLGNREKLFLVVAEESVGMAVVRFMHGKSN
jgi:hypothetical protein